MLFAQCYHLSTGYVENSIPPLFLKENKKLIPVCGSNSIIYLDGRNKIENLIEKAKEECKVRNYLGFQLFKGESLNRSTKLSELITI